MKKSRPQRVPLVNRMECFAVRWGLREVYRGPRCGWCSGWAWSSGTGAWSPPAVWARTCRTRSSGWLFRTRSKTMKILISVKKYVSLLSKQLYGHPIYRRLQHHWSLNWSEIERIIIYNIQWSNKYQSNEDIKHFQNVFVFLPKIFYLFLFYLIFSCLDPTCHKGVPSQISGIDVEDAGPGNCGRSCSSKVGNLTNKNNQTQF